MRQSWYANSVIYSLDVETYVDTNDNGIGDLPGLTSRLDYLAGLGVNCVWLLPFYASPNRDNGYDIIDYYSVDPRLGDLGDFVELLRTAEDRGIRVLVDLVVNHTSDQHPWFQQARRDPRSRYRDYYIWRETPPEEPSLEPIFPGEEDSVWDYDEEAGAYYLHRFYRHQPDLNIANPDVREEILKIMGFWLRLGVAGFRVDAAPYVAAKAAQADDRDHGHWFLREMRSVVDTYGQGGAAVLLAETDVEPDRYADFFGDANEMNLLFNFLLNNELFLALACDQAWPLRRGLRRLPPPPSGACYANWVRNHDELDLERLSKEERQQVFDAFAPDPDMRIFDRGIRRRLPPMLGGDRRRIELAYSTVFGLPGAPVLRYGEEIGMGEDLSQPGRSAVRTVMQWSADHGGGFSRVPPNRFARPVVDSGDYRYEVVNVADQRYRPDSLLNWMERLCRLRQESHEIGDGEHRLLDTSCDDDVLALRYDRGDQALIVLSNFAREGRRVQLPGCEDLEFTVELLGDREYERQVDEHGYADVNGHGYRWLRGRTKA